MGFFQYSTRNISIDLPGSKGYAYVDFDSPEHVAEAVEKFSGAKNTSLRPLNLQNCLAAFVAEIFIHKSKFTAIRLSIYII